MIHKWSHPLVLSDFFLGKLRTPLQVPSSTSNSMPNAAMAVKIKGVFNFSEGHAHKGGRHKQLEISR